jgi:hypothetical protein
MLAALLVAAAPNVTSRTSPPPPRPPPRPAIVSAAVAPAARLPALLLFPLLIPIPVPLAMALPAAERDAVLGLAPSAPERAGNAAPMAARNPEDRPRRTR